MKNIFLLPTDKGQRITKTDKGTFLFCSVVAKDFIEIRKGYSGYHLYITSDEEIKEGDFIIEKGKPIVKCKTILDSEDLIWESLDIKSSACDGIFNFKKIILTTDQDLIEDGVQAIDNEFLEWFVKNPSCESVEVSEDYFKPSNIVYGHNTEHYKIIFPKAESKQEYEYIGECRGNDGNGCFMDSPAHNCGCFVRKPKQETTLEEIAKKVYPDNIVQLSPTFFHNTADIRRHDFIQGYNLHKGELYSEEEMISFAEFVATYPDKNRNVYGEMLHSKSKYDGAERTIDLLEQFKKK
jgi:hypothetical protein